MIAQVQGKIEQLIIAYLSKHDPKTVKLDQQELTRTTCTFIHKKGPKKCV